METELTHFGLSALFTQIDFCIPDVGEEENHNREEATNADSLPGEETHRSPGQVIITF